MNFAELVNHHKLFQNIKRVDHWFLLINGLLLMGVTIVPFPTSLLAEYIKRPDAPVAAAVYSGAFVLISVLFNFLWRYASYENRLLKKTHDPRVVRGITKQYWFGPPLYVLALVLAFVSVTASV